jgi:hypothetical protein
MWKLGIICFAAALGASACAADELGVDGLEPGLGVIRGGERITIRGSGFDRQQMVTVYFGDRRAEHVAIVAADELWATTPAVERAGPVDVRVIAADGTEFRISSGFEFVTKNEMAECINVGRALNGEQVTERKSIRQKK